MAIHIVCVAWVVTKVADNRVHGCAYSRPSQKLRKQSTFLKSEDEKNNAAYIQNLDGNYTGSLSNGLRPDELEPSPMAFATASCGLLPKLNARFNEELHRLDDDQMSRLLANR